MYVCMDQQWTVCSDMPCQGFLASVMAANGNGAASKSGHIGRMVVAQGLATRLGSSYDTTMFRRLLNVNDLYEWENASSSNIEPTASAWHVQRNWLHHQGLAICQTSLGCPNCRHDLSETHKLESLEFGEDKFGPRLLKAVQWIFWYLYLIENRCLLERSMFEV